MKDKIPDFLDGVIVGFGVALIAFGWAPWWVGAVLLAVGSVAYVSRVGGR